MVKFILSCLLLFSLTTIFAQQRKPVASGFITLGDGKMTGFSNLQFIDGKVLYHDIATRKNELTEIENVALITDDNQATVYKGALKAKPKVEAVINDTLYRPKYPSGIYVTKEDFINKKPNTDFLMAVDRMGSYLESAEHNCFFVDNEGDKIKNVFAISFKGHLYFQVNAITKYKNNKDKAQAYDVPHQFVRVILGGENYLYTEAEMTNVWAKGAAYGGIGGTAGHHMARSVVYGKGIVWDIKNNEFNIFRNCKDYNRFIGPILANAIQQCDEHMPDLFEVRKAIDKIK